MNPLKQIIKAGLTEKVALTTYAEIKAAVKTQVVFCDVYQNGNEYTGIPVRNARRFIKGGENSFEVETLEGWTVPVRAYYMTRKKTP